MMIKSLLSFILMFFTCISFASEKVSVSIQPGSPVVNEEFELIFKIKLKGDEEPYISFDPGGASVTSRSNRGVSLKTTIINGKFTTVKEVTYVYNLLATRMGSLYIKNIKVDFGKGATEDLKDLRINILREAQKPKDIFVMAIPSKNEVYVGEGFDVNYYLYHRVNVLGSELEKYPALGDFLKRFHLVNETVETVRYKGELYRRSLKYSARLFAQKSGTAKIDALRLKVQYSSGNSRGNFGFGIQLGQVKVRSFLSEKIDVTVLPLPTENVPTYFTGLVGEHQFSLSIPRNKYVVNEAIEAKLEIQGVGALEAYAGPKILNHKDLEEFDTKGEIQPINNQVQKKIFDYTYLARSSFEIPEHIEKVAYFDPDKKEYITKELLVPKITISGGASNRPNTEDRVDNNGTLPTAQRAGLETKSPSIVGIDLGKKRSSGDLFKILNVVLFVIILGLVLSFFWKKREYSTNAEVVRLLIKKIKKEGATFSELYTLLNFISEDLSLNVKEKVRRSNLSSEAKAYFLELLHRLERGTFSIDKNNEKSIEKKYFRELQQVIK